jgi:peptidoglycan-associated lipoprotein
MLRRGIVALTVTTIVTVLFVLGCGLYPEKPTQELADAKAAQEEAKAASAPEHAPQEYAAAEELLAKGEELINVECKVEESRKLLLDARSKFIEAREKGLAEKARLAVPPPPPPMPAPLPLKDIFFDFDRSEIRADAAPVLQENAELLKANPGVRVLIEGYCDIRGSVQYNLALGQRRAQATKDFLVQQGIDPGRIDMVSQGETTKFGAGTTERAFQLNRRAHFVPQTQPGT